MRKIYYKSSRDPKVKSLNKPRSGSWIHFENATIDDIHLVSDLTGLTIADIDDALDVFEIPRIEHHDNAILLFIKSPADKDDELYTQPITVIITEQYFITISPNKNRLLEHFTKSKDYLTTKRSQLFLQLLLTVTDSFTKKIKLIRNEVQLSFSEERDVTDVEIKRLTKNELILNQYLVDLIPMKNVLETILNGRYLVLYDDDSDLVEDMLISIKQSVDVCKVNLKGIQSVRDAHQIIFTNKLNKTMQFLTSFTIILTIPTIVASIYGMNVRLPLDRHPFAFVIIMGFTLLLSVIALIIFRKLKWF